MDNHGASHPKVTEEIAYESSQPYKLHDTKNELEYSAIASLPNASIENPAQESKADVSATEKHDANEKLAMETKTEPIHQDVASLPHAGGQQQPPNATPAVLDEMAQQDQSVSPAGLSRSEPPRTNEASANRNLDLTRPTEEGNEQVLANDRPTSVLSYPLTHPNGASIFPSLSASEQEIIAREALNQAEDNIVADNLRYGYGDDASDGGYESDGLSSASTSAESSVRNYLYENGRRYHSFREGIYNFPNDDVEQEREDMKHAMLKLLCSQKLHFAPITNNPQEVLDIGTGTGIWAIEMGDQYPSAQILGVDLSPIQPDWLPPNVKFLVDDIESPWLHARDHFDYIHSRHTVMAVKDWMKLFRRALEHLKPGGWIELQEIHHSPRAATGDGIVPPDHPVAQFWSLVSTGLRELGIDLNIAAEGQLAAMMQAAGFVNVTERVLHVPIGTWPKNKVLKTVGLYWRTILLDGLQAIALGPLTRGLRWKREEVEVFLTSVRRAYHDNAALMYMPLHVVYAQKPAEISS